MSPTTIAVWSMPRKSRSVGRCHLRVALARRETAGSRGSGRRDPGSRRRWMPPAFGFQSGSRCGPVEACSTPVLPQPRVGAVHVAHDDRDVLEPAVVAARVRAGSAAPAARGTRSARSARRRAAARTTRMRSAEDAVQLLVARAPTTSTSETFSNAEHVGVERDRAVHVGHGHADGVDGLTRRAGVRVGARRPRARQRRRATTTARRPASRDRRVMRAASVRRGARRAAPAGDRRRAARWP